MKVILPCMRRIRPPNLTIVRRQTPLQGRVLSDPERRANDWVAAWEEDATDATTDGDGGVIFETHKRAARPIRIPQGG